MTNPIYETYKPPGFHTMTPYLMVHSDKVLDQIEFLTKAFHAVEMERTVDDKGVIRNVILRVGDTCFMMGTSAGTTVGASFVLYVDDPDAMHARAIQNGAKDIMKVEDRDYGDRQGGVEDLAGNKWWISKRLEEKPY